MRKFCLLLALCLIIPGCLGACGKSQEESGSVSETSAEFGELPQTIKINAQMPEDYPQTLKIYRAEKKTWEPSEVGELFFPAGGYESVENAMGVQLVNSAEGYIAYVNDNFVLGDLNYWVDRDEWYGDIVNIDGLLHKLGYSSISGDNTAQIYGAENMAEYGAGDLALGSKTDAQKQVEEKLSALGIGPVELYISEARDAKTMNENRDILLENDERIGYGLKSDFNDAIRNRELSQEDEHYYLSYRQTLDGVPVSERFWPRTGETEDSTFPRITAHVDANGIKDLSLFCPITVGEAEKTVEIMSPAEALEVYLKEYKGSIHFDFTEVDDIELCYVLVEDSEKMLARPAWMISLFTKKESDNPDYLDYQLDYTTIAVTADTGVILESNLDMR